jgi:hypothetical protein
MEINILTGDLIENMPEVSEHVISGEEVEPVNTELTPPVKGESLEIFDPEIHCVGPDGLPVLTKAGGFRKRPGRGKGGQKQGSISKKVSQEGNNDTILPETPEISREEMAKATAEKIDFLYWTAMNLALPCKTGTELKPQFSPVAIEAIKEGLLEEEEIPNVPWYLIVSMVYASATMAILQAEENKPKLLSFKDRVILFFAKRRKGQSERAN